MMTYRGSGGTKIELVVRATDKDGFTSFATLEYGEVVWKGSPLGIRDIESDVGVNREARLMLEDLQKIRDTHIAGY